MLDDDLCYMPATEALARFRDRSLSPVELTESSNWRNVVFPWWRLKIDSQVAVR